MTNDTSISVVCAIIEDTEKILVAQRNYGMPLPLKWEFPGGKVEQGETKEKSIIREIREELDVEINIVRELTISSHFDGERQIHLVPFICKIINKHPRPVEHLQLAWCSKEECEKLEWCPADIPILREYWTLKSSMTCLR